MADAEIVDHRQRGEQIAAFGDVHDAAANEHVGRLSRDRLSTVGDAPRARSKEPGDCAQCRRLTGAVGAGACEGCGRRVQGVAR